MSDPSDSLNGGTDYTSLLSANGESFSGILSNQEQMEWMHTRPQPNRCIFSTLARRFVIRPDHFCGWTASWIGKRNHKFFWLFNFWGSIYITVFTIYDALEIASSIQDDSISFCFIVYATYAVLGLFFGLMTISFTFGHGFGILINQTSWEEWNQIVRKRFSKGVIDNVEDVCGSRRGFWCWLCPFSPWRDKSNEELIEDYRTYRDDGDPDNRAHRRSTRV
jgi:hypothetical protein